MAEFDSIEKVSQEIKNNLNSITDKKSIALLYAFNATWKTRLSVDFNLLNEDFEETFETEETKPSEIPNIKVFSYNAFIEDLFSWNNENFILNFKKHWVFEFIEKQGLEWSIKDVYKDITNSKVEPKFNYRDQSISFPIITVKDDGSIDEKPIKISKSEESIFIWSIYYAILEIAIESLNTTEDLRVTKKFNNLEYVVVDDPVSSIDDTWIITVADKLFQTIRLYNGNKINFLITTHHALFYNVLFNSFRRLKKSESKKFFYILSKNNSNNLKLKWQDEDSPFAYHLSTISMIKETIKNWNIERYHFNLFRSLLEKTANFLGYSSIDDCILWDNKSEYVRIINIYSHGKISELEYNEVQNEHKEIFIECFNKFIENFKYNF